MYLKNVNKCSCFLIMYVLRAKRYPGISMCFPKLRKHITKPQQKGKVFYACIFLFISNTILVTEMTFCFLLLNAYGLEENYFRFTS